VAEPIVGLGRRQRSERGLITLHAGGIVAPPLTGPGVHFASTAGYLFGLSIFANRRMSQQRCPFNDWPC